MANIATKRVQREFREVVNSEEVLKCKIELVDETYTRLRGEIAGPPDTPFEAPSLPELPETDTLSNQWQTTALSNILCLRILIYILSGLVSQLSTSISTFIRKFPYNTRSDWLKQHALPENRAQVDDVKLSFKFLLRNFDKFDPN